MEGFLGRGLSFPAGMRFDDLGDMEHFVANFEDLDLPEMEGVEFVDYSAELDELLYSRKVSELGLDADITKVGEKQGTDVSGYGATLRQIIQARARIPIVGSLVIAYDVEGSKEGQTRHYFINGEVISSPEDAERKGIRRLATVMRMDTFAGRPGLYIPMIPPHSLGQQMTFFPDITRNVQVTTFAARIGPVVGVRYPELEARFHRK